MSVTSWVFPSFNGIVLLMAECQTLIALELQSWLIDEADVFKEVYFRGIKG